MSLKQAGGCAGPDGLCSAIIMLSAVNCVPEPRGIDIFDNTAVRVAVIGLFRIRFAVAALCRNVTFDFAELFNFHFHDVLSVHKTVRQRLKPEFLPLPAVLYCVHF